MNTTAIVSKISENLKPTCFEVTEFRKPERGEKMSFEVNVIAESEGRMKKRAIVETNLPTWGTFSVECDEGGALGVIFQQVVHSALTEDAGVTKLQNSLGEPNEHS